MPKPNKQGEPRRATGMRARVRAFMNLPSHQQHGLARDLGLTDPGDETFSDADKLINWVGRAKEKGILDKLMIPDEASHDPS